MCYREAISAVREAKAAVKGGGNRETKRGREAPYAFKV
jgi:hypothetical protein